MKDVKRVVNVPNYADFSTERIWNSIKSMPNSSQILLYFPSFSPKVFPNKSYMINIVNTLDPGLIIKTLKEIKKKRE